MAAIIGTVIIVIRKPKNKNAVQTVAHLISGDSPRIETNIAAKGKIIPKNKQITVTAQIGSAILFLNFNIVKHTCKAGGNNSKNIGIQKKRILLPIATRTNYN